MDQASNKKQRRKERRALEKSSQSDHIGPDEIVEQGAPAVPLIEVEQLELPFCTRPVFIQINPQIPLDANIRVFRRPPQGDPQLLPGDLLVINVNRECTLNTTLNDELTLCRNTLNHLRNENADLTRGNTRFRVLGLVSECLRYFGIKVIFPLLKQQYAGWHIVQRFQEWYDVTNFLRSQSQTTRNRNRWNQRQRLQQCVNDIVRNLDRSLFLIWRELWDLNSERNDFTHPSLTYQIVDNLRNDAGNLGQRECDNVCILVNAMHQYINPVDYETRSRRSNNTMQLSQWF